MTQRFEAERPLIDLKRNAGKFQHGDITAYLTWAGDNRRPCLVLVPSWTFGKANLRRVTPCIVPMDNAWKWDAQRGLPGECAATSMAFAEALGLSANLVTAMRITTIIHDHLQDLIRMRPETHRDGATYVAAEIIRTNRDTGEQVYTEVHEHA